MIENIKNNDLIITPNNIKMNILKEIAHSKQILNIKFMTLEEFKKNYFGTYSKKAIYYLIKKHNLKYEIALKYLDNIFYNAKEIKPYYTELKENELIIENKMFKKSLKSIVIIDYAIDPYLKNILDKYNTRYITTPQKEYTPKIYEFSTQEAEVSFIATKICELLKTVNINDIYLINTSSYINDIKRIFKQYNLPINLETSTNIYGTTSVKTFLNRLKETKNIQESLENLPQNDIYNAIISVLNDYAFLENVDEDFIETITGELKRKKIRAAKLENAISVCELSEMKDGKYYFLLGFNQGTFPQIYQDNDLIKDKEKEKLGISTSVMKFKTAKQKLKNNLKSNKNLTISYRLRDKYNSYYPSPLIQELGLKEIKNPEISHTYSNAYNQKILTEYLDNYVKFGEINKDLKTLYTTYQTIPYMKYENDFKGNIQKELENYLKENYFLSYSSLNNYFHCTFKFYIQNILKIDKFEQNFSALIGSLFHECLSQMYKENFDLDKCYNNYLKDTPLTHKEKFFIKKLKPVLENVIETIQKQEKYSELNQTLTEQKIILDTNNSTIKFKGFIDKIKYKEEDGKVLMAIIDYKTGYLPSSLDNITYGFNLQLPVYIYLTTKGLHKNVQIVGFYLQKILNTPSTDSKQEDEEKKLKLDGYTINNENLISKFDKTYQSSKVIKGMSTTKSGFSHYTKLVTLEDIENINQIVEEKINEVTNTLKEGIFKVNPKRLDDKLIGCEYCKFKDLCFRKEENIINIKTQKFGGEKNA